MILLFFILFLYFIKCYANNQTIINNNTIYLFDNFEMSVENLKNHSTTSLCKIMNYSIYNDFAELKSPYSSPKCFPMYINNYVHIVNGFIKYKYYNPLISCKYQCNYQDGESKILMGSWIDINKSKPDCDVFEVQCKTTLWPNFLVFKDLYLHVAKQEKKPEKVTFLKDSYKINTNNKKYNVHLIILDSISYYSALRGLKNTINYLENEYSGVTFKIHNKIGSNSQPNGHGFLLNRRISPLHNFLDIEKSKISDYEVIGKTGCNEYLDNEPFIAKYYRQLNYTVLSGEDFLQTIFTSHECKGFNYTYAHHSTRPYVLRMYNKKYPDNELFSRLHNSKCKGNLKYQFEYLEEFIKIYNNSKQFTFTWITNIAHEHLTGHYEYDNYLKTFFKSNKKLFDNGFLILMSDHGFRLGSYRKTKIGTFEDKNPFLLISSPKDLRNNNSEVLKNLKINSNKHTSHFDIYATMLDILTEGGNTNFKNMSYFNFTNIIKNDKIKGTSLLREINNERTCYQMEITSEYCLCREEFIKYNRTSNDLILNDGNTTNTSDVIVKKLKKNFIDTINKQLEKGNITKYCKIMEEKINGEFELKYYYTNNKNILFYLKQEVLPKGLFEAYINEDGEIISSTIERLDRYGPYAEQCVPNNPYKKFCYCKQQGSQQPINILTKANTDLGNLFKKFQEDTKSFFKKLFPISL
uniref:Sulfatase N-terminal domain-containing protein n=1 Tax=Strongyloides stercoralis TaxID=6248 RepID=A0A0K0DWQ2_STRER